MANPLERPVATLGGVGAERADQLARLGVRSIHDLLRHRPRRHEDRRQIRPISQLPLREPVSAAGRVVASGTSHYRQRTQSVFEIILEDGTGRLHCRWWNLPFMARYFAVGDEVWVYGKLHSLKPRTMDHPETEVIEDGEDASVHRGRLVPVYPLTEGLPQRWLRSLLWRVVHAHADAVPDPWTASVGTALGKGVESPLGWSCASALRRLHFPEEPGEPELARQRLALDELIHLQLALQERRRRFERQAPGRPCAGDNRLMRPFLHRLGMELTEAQTRVLREIRTDLRGNGPPMRRLLQGDVGSGKTLVAACTALMAIESGYNVVLMAPTDILAGQHFLQFTRWFLPLGVGLELRTGGRREMAGPPAGGGGVPPRLGRLVIGTHALTEETFALDGLGLVIIDEQHKFGVEQRETLLRKGHYPHLLVMTATPIPRTLALTLYGDLEVSTMNQRPGGRGRLRTFVRPADRLPKVWAFVREQLALGRQAYIVYPLVEGADLRRGRKAVLTQFEQLQQELAPHPVGLLHGRLAAAEKDRVMTAFRAGEVHALLATSVIEVGVDVPNATVLVIENAEQFGLAQLHQLRGRIGRGAHESYCILVTAKPTAEAAARLHVLERSQDGFEIAEADLTLRGPGELLGRDQSGLPSFRFADLARDGQLVQAARRVVAEIMAARPPAGDEVPPLHRP